MKQDEAFHYFRAAAEARRLAQGYIVIGPVAGAAGALATRIVSLLLCKGSPPPCGTCPACRQVAEKSHADLMWIEPSMKSRIISIDQVREIGTRFSMTAAAGGWKTAVIASADRMMAAAANAFLKTLEEPPGQSLFLLLTDNPGVLLPTIVSRCQTVTVSGEGDAPADRWVEALCDILCRPEFLSATAGGRGYPAVAAQASADLVQGLFELIKKAAGEQVDDEAEEGVDKETREARVSALYRGTRTRVMQALLEWQRDVLVLVTGAESSGLRFPDRADALRRIAASTTPAAALHNVRTVERMYAQMEGNVPEGTVLAGGFAQMQRRSSGRGAAHVQGRRSPG